MRSAVAFPLALLNSGFEAWAITLSIRCNDLWVAIYFRQWSYVAWVSFSIMRTIAWPNALS